MSAQVDHLTSLFRSQLQSILQHKGYSAVLRLGLAIADPSSDLLASAVMLLVSNYASREIHSD